MKKILLSLIISVVFFSCSRSQVAGSDSLWTTIQYVHNSGPVSPQYQYTMTVTLNNDGTGNFDYIMGSGDVIKINKDFKFSKDSIKILTSALKKSRLLADVITEEKEHPIGGQIKKVKVIIVDPDPNKDQPPKIIESPYFPSKEYVNGLNEFYKIITRQVPENILEETEKKFDEQE